MFRRIVTRVAQTSASVRFKAAPTVPRTEGFLHRAASSFPRAKLNPRTSFLIDGLSHGKGGRRILRNAAAALGVAGGCFLGSHALADSGESEKEKSNNKADKRQ